MTKGLCMLVVACMYHIYCITITVQSGIVLVHLFIGSVKNQSCKQMLVGGTDHLKLSLCQDINEHTK